MRVKNTILEMKLLFIAVFSIVLLISFSASSLAALATALSDQGTGVRNITDGKFLESGDLTVYVYDAATGGNLVYNQTFTNAIKNGSWNVMLGESQALNLEFGKKYYRDYKINGEDASFTNTTGGTVGRQFFYSPLGDINGTKIKSGSLPITMLNLCAEGRILKVSGGAWTCAVDNTGSGVWALDNVYLNNVSDVLTFNETKLSTTIMSKLDNGTIVRTSNTQWILDNQGYNTSAEIFAVVNNGSFLPVGTKLGNTTTEIWNVVNNGTFATVSQLGSYVTIGTKLGNTSAEIFAVANNGTFATSSQLSNYVTKGSSGLITLSYNNITSWPTCVGTDKLTSNGATLSCAADVLGGTGGSNFWVISGGKISVNSTYGSGLGVNASSLCINNNCINSWSAVNGSDKVTLAQLDNGTIVRTDNTQWILDNQDYNTTQEMIKAANTTGYLINWSNVISFVDTDTDTKWTIDNVYLNNVSNTLTFNETKLSNAIMSKLDNGTIIRSSNTQWILDNQGYNTSAEIFAVVNNGTFLPVGTKLGNTTTEIWNVVNNGTFATTSQLSGYVTIGTKLGNTSSEVASMISNGTIVRVGDSNKVKISWQNITNLPDCGVGSDKLTYQGGTLQCAQDQIGGTGGVNYWIDTGSLLRPNSTFATGINVTTLCVDGSCITSFSQINGSDKVTLAQLDNGTIVRTDNTQWILDNQGYNTTQEMITAVNTTGLLLNWSNVISFVDTDTDTRSYGGGPYLYNTSNTIYLNETVLNASIDSKTAGFITSSELDNGTIVRTSNTQWILDNQGYNTSAEIFAVVNNGSFLPVGTKLGNTTTEIWNVVNNGTFATTSQLSSYVTIGTKLGNTSSEVASMLDNTTIIRNYNTQWILDNQGYNTTQEMIAAVNTTGYLINWSNVISFVDTDTDTKWAIDNVYLNNVSNTLTFNETKLSNAIMSKLDNGTIIRSSNTQWILDNQGYNTSAQIFAVVNNGSFLPVGTKLGNTTTEIWNVVNNGTFATTSQLSGYVTIGTKLGNTSSEVASMLNNATIVRVGDSNKVKISWQNITNLPDCGSGSDKLTFNGTVLKCTNDITGGAGGVNYWVDAAGNLLAPNSTFGDGIDVTRLCIGGNCINSWSDVNGSAAVTLAQLDNGTIVRTSNTQWILDNQGYNTTQEMIAAVNTTGYLINWSNVISFVDTDTDTKWAIDNVYLNNVSDVLTFNETKLNASINAKTSGFITSSQLDNGTIVRTDNTQWILDNQNYNTTQEMIKAVNTTGYLINWSNVISFVDTDTDTRSYGGGPYLYNTSNTIYLNETILNATIAAKTANSITSAQFNNATIVRTTNLGTLIGNSTIIRATNTSWITKNQLFNTSAQMKTAVNYTALIKYTNTSWITKNQNYNTSAQMIKAVNQTGLTYGFNVLWTNVVGRPTKFGNTSSEVASMLDNTTIVRTYRLSTLIGNSTIIRTTNTSWITKNQLFNTSAQMKTAVNYTSLIKYTNTSWITKNQLFNTSAQMKTAVNYTSLIKYTNTSWITKNQNYNTSAQMIKAVNQTGLTYGFNVLWTNVVNRPTKFGNTSSEVASMLDNTTIVRTYRLSTLIGNSTIIRTTNTSWITKNQLFNTSAQMKTAVNYTSLIKYTNTSWITKNQLFNTSAQMKTAVNYSALIKYTNTSWVRNNQLYSKGDNRYIYNNSLHVMSWNETLGNQTYVNVKGDTMTGNLAMSNNDLLDINDIGSVTDEISGNVYMANSTNTYYGSEQQAYIKWDNANKRLVIKVN